MNLAVFGDSFSVTHPGIGKKSAPSWPYEISNMLGANIENFSHSGTSAWYSCNNFLKNYNKFSHVIFVYTEQNRWPSLPGDLLRLSSIYDEEKLRIFPNISPPDYDIMKKLVSVHKYIFDEEFNHFVLQSIFDTVNETCYKNNIKLINVFPFLDKIEHKKSINLDKMHGPCLLNLNRVSYKELYRGLTLKHNDLSFYVNNVDYRKNHINSPNNLRFAEILFEQFNDNSLKIIDVFDDPSFNYDVQFLLDYKQLVMQEVNGNWK